MNPYEVSSQECFDSLRKLFRYLDFPLIEEQYTINITKDDLDRLDSSCYVVEWFTEIGNRYSEPMVWIGIYIAIASLFCILAMAADLFHGFQNRKFWFPCKYFSLNAASLTLITVAMKLAVDLTSPMPGYLDQATKVGSMVFMCTMMVNLMPSLGSMDNNTLLANVIGMAILVITIIVNICIQINTGVLGNRGGVMVTCIYMVFMFLLLIILISLAITIPTSKQILESKYQAISKTTPNDQQIGMSTVEKLRQCVRRYWVMAESGSPQFVMTSNPLSYASGIICVIGLVVYIPIVLEIYLSYSDGDIHTRLEKYSSYPYSVVPESDYKWSIGVICITQFIGVVVGSIAPIFRCFRVLSFTKWNIRNHYVVFKVEKYWTQKLCGWKESRLPFLPNGRRSRTLVQNLKNLSLSLCIGLQNVIVVSCKMIGLIRILLLIFVGCCSYCWKSLKALLSDTPIASSSDNIGEDLSNYVLQIEDETEFAQKMLKGISNSMDRFMKKIEKEQHNNLVELIEKSTATFEGVDKFDTDQVQPLLSVEIVNSWSLPLVTITCIVVALPNIPKDKVESLFKAVGDSLSYTYLVEENLNCASEYVNVRRATMKLWLEVEDNYKWLQNTLERSAYKGKTSIQILEWFADKAEEIVRETNGNSNGELMESFPNKLIVANSMYRIAQTILLNYQSNIEPISEEELFERLSCMIADILSACFTNLPRVITMKCHESVIEKREASVEAATKLLCRSTKIITKLEVCELPSMDPDKMAFIDEWRLHLKRSIP